MYKKISRFNSDLDVEVTKITTKLDVIDDKLDGHEQQYNRVTDILVSQLEQQLLTNMLDIQMEVDRDKVNLWGITEADVKPSKNIIDSLLQEEKAKPTPITINKECLSCLNDKHKPIIKDAFKLACLNYKSSSVPFRGNEYSRRDLFEFREMLLDDTWLQSLCNIRYLQTKVGTESKEVMFHNLQTHLKAKLDKYNHNKKQII